MNLSLLRRTPVIGLALAFFACDKPIADEAVLKGAIHENIHALETKDAETVMATIHPASPQIAATRAALASEFFQSVNVKYTLSDLRVISATPEEVKISYLLRSEKVGGPGAFVDNLVEGIDTLRPDKGTWKIYKTVPTKITDLQGKPLIAPSAPPPAIAPEDRQPQDAPPAAVPVPVPPAAK